MSELGLTDRDEQVAFCALYGAWLGGGSTTCYHHLCFSACKDEDIAVYDSLFHRLRRVLPKGSSGWWNTECNRVHEGAKRCEQIDDELSEEIDEVECGGASERSAFSGQREQQRSSDKSQLEQSSQWRHQCEHRQRQTKAEQGDSEHDDQTSNKETVADRDERSAALSDDGSCLSTRPHCRYVITDPLWCRFFTEQEGHSYVAAHEPAVASAARRGSEQCAARVRPLLCHVPCISVSDHDSTEYQWRQQRQQSRTGRTCFAAGLPALSSLSTVSTEPSTPRSCEMPNLSTDETAGSDVEGNEAVGDDSGEAERAALPSPQSAPHDVTIVRCHTRPATSSAASFAVPMRSERRSTARSSLTLSACSIAAATGTADSHAALSAEDDVDDWSATENECALTSDSPRFNQPSSQQPPDTEHVDRGNRLWSWVLLCCNDREMIRAIIDGYRRANGATAADGSQLLLTHSASLRDELVLLCLHAGYTSFFHLERLAATDCTSWSVCYSEATRWTEPVLQSGRDLKRSTVSGRVWCVTVPPHHLVLARSVLARDADGVISRTSRPVIVGQCYQNALKKDPQNVQILKDLSQLQVQRRMADGYCETRRQLLMLKTNNRGNWLAYAIGHHLAGRHNKAIDIIDSFMRTQDTEEESGRRRKREKEREEAAVQRSTQSTDELKSEVQRELAAFNARNRTRVNFEDSELHLYRLTLLTESRQWQAALDYLDDVQIHIVDSLCYLESRAMLLSELSRLVEAEHYYRALLNINADNAAYHRGLHRSLGLSADSRSDSERLHSLYVELQSDFPKSSLVRRLPLDFCHDATFSSLVSQHMQHFIRRAIPSLFTDLHPLYADKRKVQQIETIAESFIAHLRSAHTFDQHSTEEESPSCLLWTLIFAAQHYDYLGQPHTHCNTSRTEPRRCWPCQRRTLGSSAACLMHPF